MKDFSPSDYKEEHNHYGYRRITRRESPEFKSYKRRSFSPNKKFHHSKHNIVHLQEVYDKNGNPIKNAFLKLSDSQKKSLHSKNIKSKKKDPKRKLFLDSITGALGAVTGGTGDLIGGAGEAVAGAPTGALIGVGAAGAGMAARTARKEQHYFDMTKVQLKTNFEDFRRDYLDYEFTELRECNRVSARINGQLSQIEKDLAYRVNSRILELIDHT